MPRLNVDVEIVFHILILERRVKIGQRRGECRESKLSVMKHHLVEGIFLIIKYNKTKSNLRLPTVTTGSSLGMIERENTIIY